MDNTNKELTQEAQEAQIPEGQVTLTKTEEESHEKEGVETRED